MRYPASWTTRAFGVNWTRTATGERDGKSCEATISLASTSTVTYDESGTLLKWESSSTHSSEGTANGSSEFNNPSCGCTTQIQSRLQFRINEGSWRVTWSAHHDGEPREDHLNWDSHSSFQDVVGVTSETPPAADPSGEVVLPPGDYEFWMNPNFRAATGTTEGASSYSAEAGHTVVVEFERVDVPMVKR